MKPLLQPEINVGIVGHVDHGKTTLTRLLSGVWTDTHSAEKKQGITIKLGYSNFCIYSSKDNELTTNPEKGETLERSFSIVDTPGHENFISTMISGSAIMDCALLLISADEHCPQPQTTEHLKALEIAGITNIIIVQNKVDTVSKEQAIQHYEQIQSFVQGTIAENAPIIPLSAIHSANFTSLLKQILEQFTPQDQSKDAQGLMYVVRSFDINKPGTQYTDVQGGVLGGSIKSGTFTPGTKIEISPGLRNTQNGKEVWQPITTTIQKIFTGKTELDKASPGGSIAVLTSLDPTLTRSDKLVGQVIGQAGKLPKAAMQLNFDLHLFEKTIGTQAEVKPLYSGEPLMMIVNSLLTVGMVSKSNASKATINLKKPVVAQPQDRVVLFRKFGNKWNIIGYGIIQ